MEVNVVVDPNTEHVRNVRNTRKAFTREQCNSQSYLCRAYCASESCSVMSHSLWSPWTTQSMEFSRPEYRSGYPFPSPGNLPNLQSSQGSNPGLLHCRRLLHQLSHKGGPCLIHSSTWEVVYKTEEMFVLIELIIYRETQELKRKMVTVMMEDLQKIWRKYMKTVGIIWQYTTCQVLF